MQELDNHTQCEAVITTYQHPVLFVSSKLSSNIHSYAMMQQPRTKQYHRKGYLCFAFVE
jgi:hypothetical protein